MIMYIKYLEEHKKMISIHLMFPYFIKKCDIKLILHMQNCPTVVGHNTCKSLILNYIFVGLLEDFK